MSAAAIAAAVASGELTPTEAVEATRTAIGSDPFNAFTHLEDRPVTAERPGPLAGVPVALKDLIDHEGRETTAGSSFYRHRAERSATVVNRLEDAGAVIVGRTGLHEFAFGFSSENPWFGPVLNPWDPATSPGGSSGGSAAAVAAGVVPLAVGTDTGGSIRVPAALCGIAGLKVTHGRVPLTGVFPLAASIDTVGPLARTVEDLRLGFEAMAGYDPGDPWSRMPVTLPPRRATRIGVPRQWIERAATDDPVRNAFRKTLDRCANDGYEVVDLDAPGLVPAREMDDMFYGEVASVHRQWRTEGRPYGDDVAERIDDALAVTIDRYNATRAWRAALGQATTAAFDEVDVIATPTTGVMRKEIGVDQIVVGGVSRPYRTVLSRFTSLVNHMRCPAISLPIQAGGNPPPSIQLIGPPWSERMLLRVGADLERRDYVGLAAHFPFEGPEAQ